LDSVVIGAGSVVTKSIPANCIAVGNPCKVIKWLKPQYKINTLEEKDIPEMMILYCSTLSNVNIRDYTHEEIEDWVSCGYKTERWKELMSHNQYFGAFDKNNCLIGFSSMNKDGYLHSMFVHKDYQCKGVATQLLSEVEKMAKKWGVKEIISEVSFTARSFFEKHGYKIDRIQKRKANKLELTNFVMRKIMYHEKE
jgi:GNAT superfamily N-acetyltransferase